MAELREYRVTINGSETTAILSEKDAKALGAVPLDAPAAAPAAPAAAPPVRARRPVRNAARPAQDDKGH